MCANTPIRASSSISPPKSILSVAQRYRRPEVLEKHLDFKRQVVEALSAYPNAEIYDFEAVAAVTHDFNNYCDLIHFSDTVCDWMLASFHRGDHRLARANFEAEAAKLREQAQAFVQQACGSEDDFMRRFCPDYKPGEEDEAIP